MCGAQREIKKIMGMGISPDQKDVKIRELAKKYGCSLDSTYVPRSGEHFTAEVIRRIQEADRANRESVLWLLALVSSIASVVSALAVWCAILLKSKLQ